MPPFPLFRSRAGLFALSLMLTGLAPGSSPGQAMFPTEHPIERLFTPETNPANMPLNSFTGASSFTFPVTGLPFPYGYGIRTKEGQEEEWHLQLRPTNTISLSPGDTVIVSTHLGSNHGPQSRIKIVLQEKERNFHNLGEGEVTIPARWGRVQTEFAVEKAHPAKALQIAFNLGHPNKREIWFGPIEIYVLPRGARRPDSLQSPIEDFASRGQDAGTGPAPSFYFFGAEFGQCNAIGGSKKESGLKLSVSQAARSPDDIGVRIAPAEPIAAASSVTLAFQAKTGGRTLELPVVIESRRRPGTVIGRSSASVGKYWKTFTKQFPIAEVLDAGKWETAILCGVPGASIELRNFTLRVDP